MPYKNALHGLGCILETNAVLYSDLPAVLQKISSRRMNVDVNELHTTMNNREEWRLRSSMVRAGARP